MNEMTNSERSRFEMIWGTLQDYVVSEYNVGSGQRYKLRVKDVLFMLLTKLNHDRSSACFHGSYS